MNDLQNMDADWLKFHPDPKKPDFQLPEGAVDAHCHVFGPSSEFPFAAERKYTPCDAGKKQLYALRDYLGFSRNVIVQATCHGKDNRAMVDACRSAGEYARGIASVGADITEAEIAEMHEAGVRGVRFNFVKRLVDDTPRDVFISIADKIKSFGWHVVVYFEAQDLEESSDLSMGERAISQLLREKLDNEELVSVITSELNEIVVSHTNDFNNWQQKDTVVREIRRDIILKLAMLSKVHSAIKKDKIDYSKFSEKLMKYIIQHY